MFKSLVTVVLVLPIFSIAVEAQSTVKEHNDGSPSPVMCIMPFSQISQASCDDISTREMGIIVAIGPCYKVAVIWIDPFSGARGIHCWVPPTPDDIHLFGPGTVGSKQIVYGQNWDRKTNKPVETVALADNKEAWTKYKSHLRSLAGFSVTDQIGLDQGILQWAHTLVP
jgi:hypothetical protein